MKKPRVNVPALVHHKPSGRARVRLGGRDVWLGKWDAPEVEERYRRAVAEWLARGAAVPGSNAIAGGDPSVNDLILAYWRHAKGYYLKAGRPTSQLALIRGVLALLREHYGNLPAADFDAVKLKSLRDVLVRDGLTRTGVNRRIDAIRRAFKWGVAESWHGNGKLVPVAVYQELCAVEGLKKGRSPAPDPPKVRPVTPDEVEAVLPHLGPVARDMVLLQLASGARPGELCGLRPRDVDTSGEVWEYRPSGHKTEHHDKDRVVCFGSQAQAVLAKYLHGRPSEACCFSPAEAESMRQAARHDTRVTPLSCGNRPGSNRKANRGRAPGARYTVASYRRAIHRACDKAGVPRWSPNQLRHARATELRKLFGAEAARVVLGHSRLSTTEIYAEKDLDAAKAIMRQVG